MKLLSIPSSISISLLILLLLFICSSFSVIAADPTLDDPSTWTIDYVTTHTTEAFAKDMEEAVRLVPAVLADANRAQQYFYLYPEAMFSSPTHERYARRYLLSASTGREYERIAEAFVSADGISYIGPDNAENREIANKFFSQQPVQIGVHRRVFERFLAGEDTLLYLNGEVAGYAADGILTMQDGTTVDLPALKLQYLFVVRTDGVMQLLPKDRKPMYPEGRPVLYPDEGFVVTGTITADAQGMSITEGSIDGIAVRTATGVSLQIAGGRKLFFGSVVGAGPLHFAVPTKIRIDTKAEEFRFDGAKITALDDAPVRISGERIDITLLSPREGVAFIVPAGQVAEFLVTSGQQESEEGSARVASPVVVRAQEDTAVLLGESGEGVQLSTSGFTASGSGFTVTASPSAFDIEAHLAPENGAFFREGMVTLPPPEADKVAVFQEILKSAGLYGCGRGCAIDGKYGPNTAMAVSNWQRAYNGRHDLNAGDAGYLWPGGMLGPLTRAAMLEAYEFRVTPVGGAVRFDPVTGRRAGVYAAGDAVVSVFTHTTTPVQVADFDIRDGNIWYGVGTASPATPRATIAAIHSVTGSSPAALLQSLPIASMPALPPAPPLPGARLLYIEDGALRTTTDPAALLLPPVIPAVLSPPSATSARVDSRTAVGSTGVISTINLAQFLQSGNNCAGFACRLVNVEPQDAWVLGSDSGQLIADGGIVLHDRTGEGRLALESLQPRDLIFLYNRGSDYATESQRVSGAGYTGNRAPTHVMAVIGYRPGPSGVLEPWVAHQIGSGRTRSGAPRLKALRVEPLSALTGRGQVIRVIRPNIVLGESTISGADTFRYTYGDAEVLLQANLRDAEIERGMQIANLDPPLYGEVSAQ